jgi:CheY-like chemotaxis protein
MAWRGQRHLNMELYRQEKRRLKIVVVETSEHLRLMLSVMIKPIKKEIFFAANVEDGFMLAKTVKPDLILADYGLDGSGATLCHRVRQDAGLGKTPFVLMSAFGSHLGMGEYMATGCDQVVYKPFQCMDLFVAIKAALTGDEATVPGIVPVMYRTGECDLLDTRFLDQLIRAGEIECFRRRNGLVIIGRDPIRDEEQVTYHGSERRFGVG